MTVWKPIELISDRCGIAPEEVRRAVEYKRTGGPWAPSMSVYGRTMVDIVSYCKNLREQATYLKNVSDKLYRQANELDLWSLERERI